MMHHHHHHQHHHHRHHHHLLRLLMVMLMVVLMARDIVGSFQLRGLVDEEVEVQDEAQEEMGHRSPREAGGRLLRSALREAMETVNGAYKYSRDRVKDRLASRGASPADLLAFFKQPAGATRTAVRSAETLDVALALLLPRRAKRDLNDTDFLSPQDLATIARVTGCGAQLQTPLCSSDCFSDKYQAHNSECNNRANPRLGAANVALVRWLPAEYDDNASLPRGWDEAKLHNGFALPSVRVVSNEIVRLAAGAASSRDDVASLSSAFVQWGQWTAHDTDLTPQSPSLRSFAGGLDCDSSCDRREPCFPIQVPANDTRINRTASACIPFFRSSPACGTGDRAAVFGLPAAGGPRPREQLNAITAFVDAGQVYGSGRAVAAGLRGAGGELRVNGDYTDGGRGLPPFAEGVGASACALNRDGSPVVPCFLAGEVRANENNGLIAFHAVFLREHNRVARALRELNPHWGGESVYQETRRILAAYMQIITWRDYVPRVIGPAAANATLGPYSGYDPSADPRIANVHATAAFRFGHVTVQPVLQRLGDNYREHPRYPNLALHRAFLSPWRIVEEGGVDPVLRGLIGSPAKQNALYEMMPDELREKLFAMTRQLALDLASLNLQRGRDHGLPGYNSWRSFCGLPALRTQAELATAWNSSDVAGRVLALYGSADSVDVWLAGLLEVPVEGGRVGPLFSCLLARQFALIRNGDRFWHEREGLFTAAQLTELRNVSLSRLICGNSGVREVPWDAFRYRPYPEGFVHCDELPPINLLPWKEETQNTPCGPVPSVPNSHFSMCGGAGVGGGGGGVTTALLVRYECLDGFHIAGADTISCVDNSWGDAPRCRAADPCSGSPPPCASEPNSVCEPPAPGDAASGSHRCVCLAGFQPGAQGRGCVVTPDGSRGLLVSTVVISALALAAILALGIAICTYLKRMQRNLLVKDAAVYGNKYATT
uniref:Thyroid peroxidase n=1 Tax=Petromyzon marinus TaxID=7757 RepID=A0AAJ7UJ16_PETMA|nr:eosinophil peroxidase-like [Petromyzon marinus]